MLNESAFAVGLADGLEKAGMGIHGQRAIYGASAGALAGVLSGLITPGSLSRKVKRILVAGATGAAMGAGIGAGGGAIADKIMGRVDRGLSLKDAYSQMLKNRREINENWERLGASIDSSKKVWRGREV